MAQEEKEEAEEKEKKDAEMEERMAEQSSAKITIFQTIPRLMKIHHIFNIQYII